MNSLLHKIVVFTFIVNTLTAGELSPRLVNVEFEVDGPRNKALKLNYDGSDFTLSDGETGEVKTIRQYNLHRDLRSLDTHRLRVLALNSYFVAREDGNGDYHLVHYPRLKGGGPATAWAFQNITRCVMWAIPTALTIHLAKRGLDAVCDKVPGAKNATQGGAYTASFGGVTNVIDTNMGGGALPKPTTAQTFMQGSATTGAYYVVEQMHNNPATKDFIEKAEAVAPVTVGLTASTTASSVATAATKVVTGYSAIVESVAGIAYAIGMWLPYTP